MQVFELRSRQRSARVHVAIPALSWHNCAPESQRHGAHWKGVVTLPHSPVHTVPWVVLELGWDVPETQRHVSKPQTCCCNFQSMGETRNWVFIIHQQTIGQSQELSESQILTGLLHSPWMPRVLRPLDSSCPSSEAHHSPQNMPTPGHVPTPCLPAMPPTCPHIKACHHIHVPPPGVNPR